MRVLVLSPQLSNIGNGIIGKGAVETVDQAFPDAEIIDSSAYPYYLADVAVENGGREELRQKSIGIGDFVSPDLVVFTGCVLYPHPLRRHLPLFRRFDKENVPLIFLGVGGNDYSEKTRSKVVSLLREANPDLFITRDSTAYETYESTVAQAEQGIDSGFFINDWYEPPEADKEFIVSTFDKREFDVPDTNVPIVRPNHAPFDLLRDVYEGRGIQGRAVKFGRKLFSSNKLSDAYEELEKDNLFVSENIKDYLFFYRNADVVYTDRVHAAVPSMVYGNKVQFGYDTPRAELLNDLSIEKGQFYKANREFLDQKKQEQVQMLKSFWKANS